ncbi:hypothetical protein [Marinifilum sp. D714]|uniref:hypothetical protein n=1 Tax=Marinifilum sp. D714 TaxID=2937523 RepID=UPI0027C57F15|nr:hypothetical protein [Marinifilum sp. D714]MDQ2178756.1 hypothetical protein [Marinifilum sp. D714]
MRMNESEQIDKIISELRMHLTDKVEHFHYSRIAKIPFKVHSFIEIMNLRMLDFSEAAQLLLKQDKVVPAIPLIRSLFENTAITSTLVKAVESSVLNNKLTNDFDDLITNIKFGTRYSDEIVSTNVLTQINKLDKQFNGIRKYYDALCEFTHPNWDGVEGSYSELDEINHCTHVQKIITTEHSMTDFFQSSFLFVISIFSGSAEFMRNNLPRFTEICEKDIKINLK